MKPQTSRALLGGMSILLSLALLLPLPIAAADDGVTFVVNANEDGADVFPGDGYCGTAEGHCTLRAAVMEANALPSADRIELDATFYSLSIPGSDEEDGATGDLDIYGTLTIVGQHMMWTVVDASGMPGDRALHVHPGASLTLERVSVINAHIGGGANGAGLRNDLGNVTIRHASFQFNDAHSGAGLMNVGEMHIEYTLIAYNTTTDAGAGIRNDGVLEIKYSSVYQNTAGGPGGGIENHGTLSVRNSTIAANVAASGGAAIYNGYGFYGGGASLTINNATVSANNIASDGGGGGTTGGIFNEPDGSVELSNSIVGNNGVDYERSVDCLGPITSHGYNLIGIPEGCAIGGEPSTDIVWMEPLLGYLEEDPAGTVSYPLTPASPAFDAGNPAEPGSSAFACEPIDQQLVTRPQGPRCDIGAREMPAGPEPPTDTPIPSPSPTDTATPETSPTVTPTQTPAPTHTSTPTPVPGDLFFDGFETGDLTAWSSAQTDSGDLSVSPEAALGGMFGMQAVLDDNRAIYVVDTTPAGEGTYAARFYFDPNAIVMASGNAHVVFKAMDSSSRTAFQVELRSFQGDYQLRANAPWDSGGAYNTPWFRIRDDWHLIEVLWQAASADGASDGQLTLSIDDEAVASGVGIDNDTRRVDSVRLGAVAGIDTGTRGTYYFDAFGSAAGGYIGPDAAITLPSAPPLPDAIFADGFESGDLSAWSARKNETDLLVGSGSALVGAYGLQTVADDTAPRYLTDWSPVAEKEYHVRLVFDPNSLTMLDGRAHVIFQALAGASKVIARVELRYKSLNYEVRSGILTDAGRWVNTSWWYIDDAPQVMELEWLAASDPTIADGRLVMWINEIQSETRDGIANGGLSVDLVRLGLVAGIDTGTLGSMSFDAFESRRYSHIGLPGEEPTPEPTGTTTVTPTCTPTSTPTP